MDHNTLAASSLDPSPITSPTTPAPSSTARRLVAAAVSPNTRESYRRALRQVDAWRGRRPLDDATLAAYLAVLYDAGRTPSSAVAVAAVRFRARMVAHYSAGATAEQGAVARYL